MKLATQQQNPDFVQLEKFKKLVEQAAHDIRTPLQILSMALKHRFKSLPEEDHKLLCNITNSIREIAQELLEYPKEEVSNEGKQYYESVSENRESKKETLKDHRYILVSLALADIVRQKELQYIDKNVKFKYSTDPAIRFTSIYGNTIDFKRMMSNIINNAVEAFDGKDGTVKISSATDDDNVKITVQDNGNGMPLAMVKQLSLGESVSTTKKGGYSIGTQQIRDTLVEFGGTQFIESTPNVGTKITLTIPKSNKAEWVI
jgi:signal transduction histidine kinase